MKEKTCLIMRQYRSLLMLLELVKRIGVLGFAHSLELRRQSTMYCLLRSLVEHSCVNPKSLAFGYLDEKPFDIGLMKFLGLCPS
ncbi:hypothetical protein BHE74_00014902, partial [Ensete ventricosum]